MIDTTIRVFGLILLTLISKILMTEKKGKFSATRRFLSECVGISGFIMSINMLVYGISGLRFDLCVFVYNNPYIGFDDLKTKLVIVFVVYTIVLCVFRYGCLLMVIIDAKYELNIEPILKDSYITVSKLQAIFIVVSIIIFIVYTYIDLVMTLSTMLN